MESSWQPPLPRLAPRQPGSSPEPCLGQDASMEHTDKDWFRMRSIIERLYIQENRKLHEMMAILKAKHGFIATEQMYKKRLKRWNLRKRSYRKAPREGQDGTKAVTTTPTEPLVTVEEPQNSQTPGPVQETMNRPSSALTVVHPSKLPAASSLEVVLSNVFSWTQAMLDSHQQCLDPMSLYLANPDRPPVEDSRTMYRTFELVFDLWYHGKGDLAGMAARKGFYAMEFVLSQQHPDMIWHILDTVYDMVDRGHLQLVELFLQHGLTLAYRLLPRAHPLLMILGELRRCDYKSDKGRQYICHVLRQAWLRNATLLGDHVGSLLPQHLWLYEQLIWDGRTGLRKNSDLKSRQAEISTALQHLVATFNRGSATPETNYERLRTQALMLEYAQMDLGDKQTAKLLAIDLIKATHANSGTRTSDRFQAYACKMLARIQEEEKDWTKAEQNLRKAVIKREEAHGTTDDLRVIRDLWVLAGHFQRSQRLEDANATTHDAIARAGRYLNNLPG